jgi:two-component system response regulator RegA
MICEDDEVFRKRLARSLRDRGCTVFESTSAEEGVEVAKEFKPEATIIDIRMPGKGGLWGIEQLLLLNPNIKIVVLTGFGTITTAIDAVKLGALNYLTKPATVDGIIHAFSPQGRSSPAEESIPSLDDVQREYINRVVTEFSGNVSRAAKALGLHRRSLQRMLKAQVEE